MGHVRWENSRRLTAQVITVHYRNRFRRDWRWNSHPPRFLNHRIGAFDFAYGEASGDPITVVLQFLSCCRTVTRYWTSDVEKDSSRFFAQRCSYVDVGNIAPAAIEAARRYNSSTNIRYHLLDPVGKQFPRGPSRMKRSDKLCQRPLVCDVGEDPKESLGRGNVRRVRITATRGTLSSAIPFPNLSGGSLHHELYPGLE